MELTRASLSRHDKFGNPVFSVSHTGNRTSYTVLQKVGEKIKDLDAQWNPVWLSVSSDTPPKHWASITLESRRKDLVVGERYDLSFYIIKRQGNKYVAKLNKISKYQDPTEEVLTAEEFGL